MLVLFVLRAERTWNIKLTSYTVFECAFAKMAKIWMQRTYTSTKLICHFHENHFMVVVLVFRTLPYVTVKKQQQQNAHIQFNMILHHKTTLLPKVLPNSLANWELRLYLKLLNFSFYNVIIFRILWTIMNIISLLRSLQRFS